VWRLRSDSWDFLAYTAKQLTTAATNDSSVGGLLGECFRLMDILDSIEMYFASPGVKHMADLRVSVAAKDFRLAAELIEVARSNLADTPAASSVSR
jgi:arginine decarboxylase